VDAAASHIPDVELERLVAAERPAAEAGNDVDQIALVDGLGEVGPPERYAIEHVEAPAKGELGVAAGGGSNADHGQAFDDQEGLEVTLSARFETAKVTMERVVDLEGRQSQIDRQR